MKEGENPGDLGFAGDKGRGFRADAERVFVLVEDDVDEKFVEGWHGCAPGSARPPVSGSGFARGCRAKRPPGAQPSAEGPISRAEGAPAGPSGSVVLSFAEPSRRLPAVVRSRGLAWRPCRVLCRRCGRRCGHAGRRAWSAVPG